MFLFTVSVINMGKISPACKAAAKKKFKVWPSAYASGWGVRCTKAGGPGKIGKKKKINDRQYRRGL
jgi:hypothetical protein